MGIFRIFKILQMVANRAKHLICAINFVNCRNDRFCKQLK